MDYKGFTIPDDYYHAQIKRNLAPAICFGCGERLAFVRDTHKPSYCPDCAPKASLLKKYTRPGYSPTAEERAQIFKRPMSRAGRA
jgi:predicted amidophosphoribosyltransferase